MSDSTGAVDAKSYFEQEVPRVFNEYISAKPPTDLEGQEMLITYDLGSQKYGLRVQNGTQLEVVPGGIENSQLYITISEEGLADVISGAVTVPNPLLDYNSRKRLDKIKSLKGVFRMALTKADNSLFESSTIFNAVEEPAVKVKASAADYANVVTGKLNSQVAFMTGRVKFEGSLPFLMVLGTLAQ